MPVISVRYPPAEPPETTSFFGSRRASSAPFPRIQRKRILDILDDVRKLRLGREPIVDRDERDLLLLAELEQIARHMRAASHDERAAVDPDQHGPRLRGSVAVNVDLELEVSDFLDDVRLLHERRRSLKRGQEKDRCNHVITVPMEPVFVTAAGYLTYLRAPEPGAAAAGVRT
jgi:hypothetical protein